MTSRPTSTPSETELVDDLKTAKVVEAIYEVTGIGPTLVGRNGEGDRYYTDGEIKIARLVAGCDTKAAIARGAEQSAAREFEK